MFNKKKKLIEEQNKIISDLNEKLQAQQLELDTVKAQLEAYHQREFAISRALTDAAETATRIVTDAQRESDDIHDSAQRDFMASQKKGEAVVQTAYENARDIIKDAEKTSEQKIKDTDAAVCAYMKLLNQFNDSIKEQARQAEENVKKLSDYYAQLNRALPELFAEVPQISQTIDQPAEDNIYTIQSRYLLHEDMPDRTSVPEQEEAPQPGKAEDGGTVPEQKPIPQFEAEEEAVVKVSDIVTEDVGTIDTDEFIEKTTAIGNHPFGETE